MEVKRAMFGLGYQELLLVVVLLITYVPGLTLGAVGAMDPKG